MMASGMQGLDSVWRHAATQQAALKHWRLLQAEATQRARQWASSSSVQVQDPLQQTPHPHTLANTHARSLANTSAAPTLGSHLPVPLYSGVVSLAAKCSLFLSPLAWLGTCLLLASLLPPPRIPLCILSLLPSSYSASQLPANDRHDTQSRRCVS